MFFPIVYQTTQNMTQGIWNETAKFAFPKKTDFLSTTITPWEIAKVVISCTFVEALFLKPFIKNIEFFAVYQPPSAGNTALHQVCALRVSEEELSRPSEAMADVGSEANDWNSLFVLFGEWQQQILWVFFLVLKLTSGTIFGDGYLPTFERLKPFETGCSPGVPAFRPMAIVYLTTY